MTILRVDPPYHFGWTIEGTVIQELNLDELTGDATIYNGTEKGESAFCIKNNEYWKDRFTNPISYKIEDVDDFKRVADEIREGPKKSKSANADVFMFGPDAM